MRGIVFIDRDGTLIEEVGYLAEPSRVREIPGAAPALRRLAGAGYRIAVVSNQAGIARGIVDEAQMAAVHEAFVACFRSRGVSFDGIEYCPHHPEGRIEKYRIACGCRKPATGMADRVLDRLRVPPGCPRWMVGDKMSDILMGRRLGAETILVATGYGRAERESGEREGNHPDHYVPSIREAAAIILGERPPRSGAGFRPVPDPADPRRDDATPKGEGPMDEDLLAVLACPKCKGGLAPTPDGKELRCAACRLAYRVEDDIPILLVDEATPYG